MLKKAEDFIAALFPSSLIVGSPTWVSCLHTVSFILNSISTEGQGHRAMNEFVLHDELKMEFFSLISIRGLIHEFSFLCFRGNDSLRVALKQTKIASLDAGKLFWGKKPWKAAQMMHLLVERCCNQHDRLSISVSYNIFGFEKFIQWKVNHSKWVSNNILLFLWQTVWEISV